MWWIYRLAHHPEVALPLLTGAAAGTAGAEVPVAARREEDGEALVPVGIAAHPLADALPQGAKVAGRLPWITTGLECPTPHASLGWTWTRMVAGTAS